MQPADIVATHEYNNENKSVFNKSKLNPKW